MRAEILPTAIILTKAHLLGRDQYGDNGVYWGPEMLFIFNNQHIHDYAITG